MAQPSQVPVRFVSGVSTDFPYQPLANYGQHNPFFYHTWEDDFDALFAGYTATKTGVGTIAPIPGDGGLILLTTAATAADLASLQLAAASFSYTPGKKSFFLTRFQINDALNAAFNVGFIQTTATPFAVTDGVYFSKATGSAANLTLNSMIGSVLTSIVIPPAAYALTNNTNIDLGIYIDRSGNVYGFVGTQLVGFIAQSGSAGNLARGPAVSFAPNITTANLNLTLAFQSGTASAKTMTVDFVMAAKER